MSSCSCASASSVSAPKVMVPRQRAETAHPLRPSVRYSMTALPSGGIRSLPPGSHTTGDAARGARQDPARGPPRLRTVEVLLHLQTPLHFHEPVHRLQAADHEARRSQLALVPYAVTPAARV